MHDLSLRFPDEATAIATLPMFRREGVWISTSMVDGLRCDLEILGPCMVSSDPVDGIDAEPGVDPRFHCNILCGDGLAELLADHVVAPRVRRRGWLGRTSSAG